MFSCLPMHVQEAYIDYGSTYPEVYCHSLIRDAEGRKSKAPRPVALVSSY